MPQVIHKGVLHLNSECGLVAEVSGLKEVRNHIPRGTIECVCMVLARAVESELRVGEAARGVFERLSSELGRGEVGADSLFQAMVTAHLNPDTLEDEEFKGVLEKAEAFFGTLDPERTKRRVVRSAFLGGFRPYALSRIGDITHAAASGLNILSTYEMPLKLRETWVHTWVEEGKEEARKKILKSPAAWSSGKPAGDYSTRPEQDGLTTQSVWSSIIDIFEASVDVMMHLLEDSPESVVLLKDWTRFAGIMGSEDLWDQVMRHDRVIVGDVLAVKMPEWAAEYLEASHKPERRVGAENTHLLTLSQPGKNWKASVETMLVLWSEAGGSFHFELNPYGSRETREGNAEHWNAWMSAKALEEN